MKMLSLVAIALTMALTLVSADADAARRFGGGKSVGMQRQATTPPASAPASTPSSAAAATKSPATAGAPPQAQPKRSWMGPLAGLAAGLGLAALASHFGFGEQMASMMMMGLVAMAVVAVIGFIMRRRAMAQQPAMAGAGGMQYAAAGAERVADTAKVHDFPMAGTSSGAAGVAASAAPATNIPADFDVDGFVRNAKVHFIRLQAANDAGNLEDIREFTTPEMFAEAKMNVAERGAGSQETDVVSINAEVIDVAEEATRYVVSVRFTGLLREEKNGPVEPVDELWHLVKPREGKGGWLLAGIQQTQ